MQVTVQDIFDLNEGLITLQEKELPIGVAFKLQRINRVVADEHKSAQNLRSKLLQKYKEKDLDNGRVKLKEDKLDDFYKDIEELLAQKVKVDINKIDINDLSSISATPKTLGLLHTILKEGEK